MTLDSPYNIMTMITIEEYYKNKFLSLHKDLFSNPTTVSNAEDLFALPSQSVESLVIDKVLNISYDYVSIVAAIERALVPGGVAICFAMAIVPTAGGERLWGFTHASLLYIFKKYFDQENIHISSYGNALAGRLCLDEILADQVDASKIDASDEHFPVVLAVMAVKQEL